ncbi:MAG: 1-phosphofructokinase family hexose kinase, partial [Lachnospiraceae bacterium]
CSTDFIQVESGMSRINVKLKSDQETELNGQGPELKEQHIQALFHKLDRLEEGDVLVLAGSIPGTLPSDMYEQILVRLSGRGILVIVDATRDLLTNVLKYQPFLVKPNHHELGEIFGVTLTDKAEVCRYGKKLQEMGARNVLVSMAGDGAVLVSEDGQYFQCDAPKGKVVNSVGAGDSMVAGFLTGYLNTGDYKEAFLTGVATGSASAFSTQLAVREEVEQLLDQLKGAGV